MIILLEKFRQQKEAHLGFATRLIFNIVPILCSWPKRFQFLSLTQNWQSRQSAGIQVDLRLVALRKSDGSAKKVMSGMRQLEVEH